MRAPTGPTRWRGWRSWKRPRLRGRCNMSDMPLPWRSSPGAPRCGCLACGLPQASTPHVPFALHAARTNALISVSVFVLALMAAGIFWYSHATAEVSMVDAQHAGPRDAADATTTEGDDQSGTQILLGLARDAIARRSAGGTGRQQRLRVLSQRAAARPEQPTAHDALRELFPLASEKIERHDQPARTSRRRAARSTCCANSTRTTSPWPCSPASCPRRATS